MRLYLSLFFIYFSISLFGQKQQKMEQLAFMVGEWIGTTTSYDHDSITQKGAAFEKIYYDLDSSILVIELNSEFLQLRTIIYFDEKEQTYYYHPFYKGGTAKYSANFQDGKLVVNKDENTRFIFAPTQDGGFQEYGEKFIDGVWVKYFEDRFVDTQ